MNSDVARTDARKAISKVMQDLSNHCYRVHTETIYNNIFGYLPFLPLDTRRKAARWITDKINLFEPVYVPVLTDEMMTTETVE